MLPGNNFRPPNGGKLGAPIPATNGDNRRKRARHGATGATEHRRRQCRLYATIAEEEQPPGHPCTQARHLDPTTQPQTPSPEWFVQQKCRRPSAPEPRTHAATRDETPKLVCAPQTSRMRWASGSDNGCKRRSSTACRHIRFQVKMFGVASARAPARSKLDMFVANPTRLACGEDWAVEGDGVLFDRFSHPPTIFHPLQRLKLNVGTG